MPGDFRRWMACAIFLTVVGGCLASPRAPVSGGDAKMPGSSTVTEDATLHPSGPALRFGDPQQVTTGLSAREPTIRIDGSGTMFLTALRSTKPGPNQELSSWLLISDDDGATWSPLPSPFSAHERFVANEGDIALDESGRLYFVDLNPSGVDNSLTIWDPGPKWVSSRPVQGTLALDDRPWISAGSPPGVLYAVGNSIAPVPAPDTQTGSIWFYRSMDGGLTWSAGQAFPRSFLCALSANVEVPGMVFAVCDTRPELLPTGAGARTVVAYTSHDHGENWIPSPLATFERGPAPLLPCVAAFDDGRAVIAWADGNGTHPDGSRLFAAIGNGTTWAIQELTPFTGLFQMVACAAGPGEAGVALYASTDTRPGAGSNWSVVAFTGSGRTWGLAAVADDHIGRGPGAPADFMGAAFGPDGRLRIVYEKGEPYATNGELVLYASDVYLVVEQ